MLISVIILLTSFPAPIKVSGRGGGGGFVGSGNPGGIGSGYFGGGGNAGPGYRGGNIPSGGSIRDGSNVGTGYRGGASGGKPSGGGDTGPAIVVIPKQPDEPVKVVPTPMPQVCKPEVRDCVNKHIYGAAGAPTYRGACCQKFRNSVSCVCKFLSSYDPKLSKGANGVLSGCHYSKPNCNKYRMPMPQECLPEVRHCINTHVYGGAGEPHQGGACCNKFRQSRRCICKFLESQDAHLTKKSSGILRGCHFKRNCTFNKI